jgi:Tol biopolymer transport system component
MWRLALVLVAVPVLAPASSGGGSAAPELAVTRGGNIWTIGADGTRARLLLRSAHSPAWSPDGSRLAFVSRRSGDEEIYVAAADGRGVRRLTRSIGPDLSPAWSSDGSRLVFSRKAEIWTMKANGSSQRRLVRKMKAWHEHYSPTLHGSQIVYSSNRVSNFNAELFAVPARRLTFTKGSDGVFGDDGMPDYSADGKRIAFTQLPGTIWLMNADGTAVKRLSAGVDADWRP